MAPTHPDCIEYRTEDGKILRRYSIMCRIGSTTSITPAGEEVTTVAVPVYKAAVVLSHGDLIAEDPLLVSVVFIKKDGTPAINIQSIDDYRDLVGILHPPFTHDGFYCVVFPYMELGSVKSVMTKYFPKGVPEEGILVVLKETLTRLREIHRKGFIHREICPAHIYVSEKPDIRVGFSTSVFDLEEDFQEYGGASATHIWAAAPEAYVSVGGEYTEKCDVWSVGFTALEMVYGGFEEAINKDHLEEVLKKMRKKRKISGKSIVLRNVTEDPAAKNWKKRVRVKVSELLSPKKWMKKYKKEVSKEFEEMVLRCLAKNAQDRPTVEELLQMRIFRELRPDAAADILELFKKVKINTAGPSSQN